MAESKHRLGPWAYRPPSSSADAKSRWTLESADGLVAQVVRSSKGWRCEIDGQSLKCEPHYEGHVFVPAPPTAYYRTAQQAMVRVDRELAKAEPR